MFLCNCMCIFSDVSCLVSLHAYHCVSNWEKVATSANDHHRAHALIFKERPDFVNEGCDGFLFGGYQLHHWCISDHEICSTCVFVNKQRRGTKFQCLHNICGLGGGARSILSRESCCISPKRQIVDKR